MSNSSARTMRRKASMSGSTSMNSKSNVRGLTVPSFSAVLLPCVRVTVLSLGRVMGSAAGTGDALAVGERVLHEGGRDVVLGDLLDALEHLEVMARAIAPPEGDEGLVRRETRQRSGGLGEDDRLVAEREARARPVLYALDRLQVPGALARRAEGARRTGIGPE